jgi:hypothetical protein
MMRTRATCLVVGLAAVPWGLSAQWGIAAEIGVARFAGSSRDSSGVTVGPYRPTTFELRVDGRLGAPRLVIAVLYAKTGIAGEQPGLAVVQYDAASLWEVAPQLSFRLARLGVGVDVRLEAGPALQLWNLEGESRTRVGGRAAAALEWPLARALTGSLRMSGVLSRSVFDPADTPGGVERRATRRFGVAVGLRYRL